MTNVLLDIPQPIAGSILTEWLDVVHVVFLDSAFTNRQLRPTYLKTAYMGGLVYSTRSYKSDEFEKLVNWSILRGTMMDNVQLTDSLQKNHELRGRFLRKSGAAIRHVAFTAHKVSSASYLSIKDVKEWCPNVVELEFHCKNQWAGDRTSLWEDAISDFLASSTKLRSLTIDKVTFATEDLERILTNCSTSVEKLKLTKCIGPLPAQVAISSLEELVIVQNEITAATMHAIAQNCRSLRTLRVFEKSTGDGLRDECVKDLLQGCPLLKETDVEFAGGLCHKLRVELAKRRRFTELSFWDGHNPSEARWKDVDADLAQGILAVSPNLTSLTLDGGWVTDAVLKVCAEHCPLLTDASFCSCTTITCEGVASLAHPGSLLQNVHISYCPTVGNGALSAIGQNCRNLHTVDLRECSAVTDSGIETLTKLDGGLREINIANCTQLGDIALLSIAQHCPRLRTLQAPQSPTVTDASITALAQQCRKLKDLNIGECRGITMEGVRALAQHCTALRRLKIPALFRKETQPVFPRGRHMHLTLSYTWEEKHQEDQERDRRYAESYGSEAEGSGVGSGDEEVSAEGEDEVVEEVRSETSESSASTNGTDSDLE
jgi:hypothetical protein